MNYIDINNNVHSINSQMLYILFESIAPFPDDVSFATLESTFVVLPVGMSRACIFIVAYDDAYVESNEIGTVTSVAYNPNDMVVGSTELLIIDNDGNYLAVHLL